MAAQRPRDVRLIPFSKPPGSPPPVGHFVRRIHWRQHSPELALQSLSLFLSRLLCPNTSWVHCSSHLKTLVAFNYWLRSHPRPPCLSAPPVLMFIFSPLCCPVLVHCRLHITNFALNGHVLLPNAHYPPDTYASSLASYPCCRSVPGNVLALGSYLIYRAPNAIAFYSLVMCATFFPLNICTLPPLRIHNDGSMWTATMACHGNSLTSSAPCCDVQHPAWSFEFA